jgi:hypothetical protein
MKDEKIGKQKHKPHNNKKCPYINKKCPFSLTLNLWDVKYLEHFLGGYTKEAFTYYIRKKDENVKEIKLVRIRDGKSKPRTVYDTSDGYKTLLRVINKKISQKAVLPMGVLGGVAGKTIDDMVTIHCGREALFILDFEKFFPNIKSGMIFKFFKRAKCSNEIAEILTDLVTFNGFLPQGFPTSTMMANLIAYDLDIEHLKIAEKYDLVRTRWVDDIVFSGRQANIKDAIRFIIGTVQSHGFIVNKNKTKFVPRDARDERKKPIVTGLRVDRKSPHVPPIRIHAIEYLLNKCEVEGPLAAQQIYDSENGRRTKDFQSSLQGQIKFVEKYDNKQALELRKRLDAIFEQK